MNREDDEFSLGDDEFRELVGVHVMAETAFCQRAGVLAYEGGVNDTGDEFEAGPYLDYLPNYDLAMIEEKLDQKWESVIRSAIFGVPIVVGLCFYGIFFDWLVGFGLLLGLSFAIYWWVGEILDVVVLASRRREALNAKPAEPVLHFASLQEVDWWALLKAGFEPMAYEEPFHDGYLKLIGKPWRVLRRGSVRVPVFRKRNGEPRLHNQHLLRVAAYAHLIRVCEGAEVPYGIVLLGNERKGIAVPPSKDDLHKLEIALKWTRKNRALAKEASTTMPPAPEVTNVCGGCPFGLPRLYRSGSSETRLGEAVVVPFHTRGSDEKLYHSTCGDRFRWTPPHERAKAKKLC